MSIHDWPQLKIKKGLKWRNYIVEIFNTNKKTIQTLYANFFPQSMNLEHLRYRAKFLNILEFENDTLESFRNRVRFAWFWWQSAGTQGQQKRVLDLLMGHGNWRVVKGRTQAFRIGYSQVGQTYVGQIGAYSVYIKNPSESQHRDVIKYVQFAMAPYLEWRVIPE